jgi:putative transcriptional regulator
MVRTPFADWLYRLRAKHLQLTQADFAARLRVTTGTVQRWEYGTRQPHGPALLLLEQMSREASFEPPPAVETGRGPRQRKEE